MADRIWVDRWEDVFGKLPVNDSSYLFIATREHSLDLICLRFALQSPARYIGMLGGLGKNRSLFEALETEGVDPAQFKRVCVPVGIDMGRKQPRKSRQAWRLN